MQFPGSTKAILALLLATASSALAGTLVVVPNAEVATAGNAPFSFATSPTELQEIFGSGQFSGSIDISDLLLRSATGTGPLSFSFSSFEITISTTQAYPNTAGPDTLPSTTFADNVGPDATTVFDGPLSVSSPGCSGPGPCPFDIVIPFSTPFDYDPANGRLLVDIVTSAASGSITGYLDGESYTDSTLSKIASVSADAGSATGTIDLGGPIGGFESPEPASLLLLFVGIAVFIGLRLRPAPSSSRSL